MQPSDIRAALDLPASTPVQVNRPQTLVVHGGRLWAFDSDELEQWLDSVHPMDRTWTALCASDVVMGNCHAQ